MNNCSIVCDEWLAGILSCPVYRLVCPENSKMLDLFKEEIAKVLRMSPVFAFAKLPTKMLEHVHLLEQSGFRLVDTNIQLNKPVQSDRGYSGNCTVRFALPDDNEKVAKLGGSSFKYSRFHLDPLFSKEIADKIKEEWVINYFTGKRGNAMVVAEIRGDLVGFLQLIYSGDDTLIIDLIAVDKQQRRKGIAGDMIAFAEENCKKRNSVVVGTQLANLPSLRLYEGLGFSICAADYVLHYHN